MGAERGLTDAHFHSSYEIRHTKVVRRDEDEGCIISPQKISGKEHE